MAARRRSGVVELGSGHGLFTAVLRDLGAEPVCVDRLGPNRGASPTVVGDVLHPPLGGGFGLVVAANLLRHVWPRVRHGGPTAWRDLVAPGGCLWILEDQPCAEPAAARHYRDLQEILAGLQGPTRGALLPVDIFRRASRAWRWAGPWRCGEASNRWPADADRVLAMLAAGAPQPDGPVDRLMRGIAHDGLSYGRCWWARWQPEAAA